MDYTKYLREDQWERIKETLSGKVGDVARSHRRALALAPCVRAMVWCPPTVPTVGESRDLQMMFNALAVDADTEWLMIDATIIRAHQHAVGAKGGSRRRP